MNPIPPAPEPTLPDTLAAVARTPGSSGHHEFAALMAEVANETNFKPDAVNEATGAEGPYQFVAQTWLHLLRTHGVSAGVKQDLLRQITADPKGHLHVADPQSLKDLLALRHDTVLASTMAAHYLDEGAAFLKKVLHRDATDAETHLAYLLGPSGAATLIHAALQQPGVPVDHVIGAAAAANPSLFQTKDGHVRTAAQAMAFLAAKYQSDRNRAAASLKEKSPAAKIDA